VLVIQCVGDYLRPIPTSMLIVALATTVSGFHSGIHRTSVYVSSRCTHIKAIGIDTEFVVNPSAGNEDAISAEEQNEEHVAVKVVGAVAGVSVAALAGVQASEALTDYSIGMLDYGSTFDTVSYVDWLISGVDAINQVMPNTPGELAFAVAVSVDVAALATMISLGMLSIRAKKDQTSATKHHARLGEAAEGEACVVSGSSGETLCGDMSFDSTDDYVCVESLSSDGKIRWVCAGNMRYAA